MVSLFIILALRMVYNGDISSYNLNFNFQKLIRYELHFLNYKESLDICLTPLGLRLCKKPVIKAISADFYSKWTGTLHDAEQRLIKLLLEESHHVI